MKVYAQQHDTLDAIVWRYCGRTAGLVEAVLELNPGLAALGPLLPHGCQIELPDVKPAAVQKQLIQLWD